MKRLFFKQGIRPGTSGDAGRWANNEMVDTATAVDAADANLISSHTGWKGGNQHLPCLDIDLPCQLLESSPGKFHLYIDQPMSWAKYRMLLTVLADVGIIEEGYAGACIAKGATFLRKPGTFKDAAVNRNYSTFDPNTEVVISRTTYQLLRAAGAALDIKEIPF